MFKIIYLLPIIFIAAIGCNSNKKDEEKISANKKLTDTATNAYNTDTFYNALPNGVLNLNQSQNMQELLAQNWIMDDDKDALESANDGDKIEIPVRTFAMAPDFTVVKNCRNSIDIGTWKFDADKKTISFKYNDGSSDLYKLRALAADEIQITNIGGGSESVLKLVSDGTQYKNKEDDPFYSSNNKWRIKPHQPETDAAIKQRLKDNLHFFILYYKDCIAKRAKKISFYGFPTCLKWYAGGIYMVKEKDLNPIWKECFYNDAQAMKAYKIMEDIVDKPYNWPKEKITWVKKNLFVLEQMYQNL